MSPPQVAVAAVDLDDTLIAGQSQELLIRFLVRRRAAPFWLALYALMVTVLYRLGRPLDFAAIQRRVVRSFAGTEMTRMEVLYDEFVASVLAQRIRDDGRREIEALTRAGAKVILVSSAIHPLVDRISRIVGAAGTVATQLSGYPNGRFSGRIEGAMPSGAGKVDALRAHADEAFGPGGWRLWRAYGDHEADIELLASADEAVAVCPRAALQAVAVARGWKIAQWN